MKEIITKRSKRYWQIFGLISMAALVYMFLPFIDVILYGLFVYYVTRPIYDRINKRINKKSISAGVSLFILILPVLIIALYATSVASFELTKLLESIDYAIPGEYMKEILNELSIVGQHLTPEEFWEFMTTSTSFKDFLIVPIASLINIVFKLFLMFTIGFYLLKDGYRLRKWFLESSFGIENELSRKFLDSVDEDLYRIFFGNILIAGLTSVLAVILFYILNIFAPESLTIPYPFLLGLLCGLAIFVPGIGIKIIWIPMFLYLIGQAYFNNILLSAGGFLLISLGAVVMLIDIAPDIVLRPIICSKRIHPGVMLLAYLFGYVVFGFMGLFLGPVIVIVATNFIEIILPKMHG